ncbi:hypothetical protein OSB04_011936 [Centaurea solstitialis]|uniref:Gag-Pol polyprotein n=1 Tax=Centaurea solstitialis TaxID=347529 RepID=A0AA38TTI4_9ASTR|nr:hypothetical protein OSB04_011936 [Centaurea solstitialis]
MNGMKMILILRESLWLTPEPLLTLLEPLKKNLQDTKASPQSTIIFGPSASNTLPSIPEASPTQVVITSEQPSQEDCPVIPDPTLPPHSLKEITSSVHPPHTTRWTKDHPFSQVIGNISKGVNTRATANYCLFSCFVSQTEPKKVSDSLVDPFWVEAMQDELTQFDRNQVWTRYLCQMEKWQLAQSGCSETKRMSKVLLLETKLDLWLKDTVKNKE